ncbi:MAG: Gfo/Idh/MocA family protein [Acidimicrobiales bacterium]
MAVLGAGGMGACHADHIDELAGAEVGWVADPDEATGRATAERVGADWLADGHEALAAADAVVVATPDRFHHELVAAAIEQRLPVLCEKPLTVELGDALALLQAEIKAGRRLVQVGFMREYHEAHVQVRDAMAPLGEVNHLRCVHRNTNKNLDGRTRTLDEMLVQSLIHDIHTVRFLSGTEITSVVTKTVERERGLRFVLLTCELSNGGLATIEFDDAAAGYEVWVEVDSEGGNVVAAQPLRASVRRSGALASTIGDDWFSPFLDAYRAEMQAWLLAAASGTSTGPTVWDGYAAQVVVEAAVRSGASGAPEPVELSAKPDLYSHPEPREIER